MFVNWSTSAGVEGQGKEYLWNPLWILPDGSVFDASKILWVTPAVDDTGKTLEERTLIFGGGVPVSVTVKGSRNLTALAAALNGQAASLAGGIAKGEDAP